MCYSVVDATPERPSSTLALLRVLVTALPSNYTPYYSLSIASNQSNSITYRLGHTPELRAESSRRLEVAEPAVATRTKLSLLENVLFFNNMVQKIIKKAITKNIAN